MPTRMGTGMASGAAAREVGLDAARRACGQAVGDVKLTLVLASPSYDLIELLAGVREVVGEAPLMGCSSAGEFSQEGATAQAVIVAVLTSERLEVRLGVGRHLAEDLQGAVREALSPFIGTSVAALQEGLLGRTLFVLADGLVGCTEELIEEVVAQAGAGCQLVGGAAADDGRFEKTFVFYNGEALSNSFVCAEVLSERPMGIGMRHGWRPISEPLRVTRAEGVVIYELNGRSAWGIYEELARRSGQRIEEDAEASAFLMDHILGVAHLPDELKLRVPLRRRSDGALVLGSEVPTGSLVRIMQAEDDSIIGSCGPAVELAKERMDGQPIAGAMVFECVANRLRLGKRFPEAIEAITSSLDEVPMIGCCSYGQLARVRGDFSGVTSSTTLVCLIPE